MRLPPMYVEEGGPAYCVVRSRMIIPDRFYAEEFGSTLAA